MGGGFNDPDLARLEQRAKPVRGLLLDDDRIGSSGRSGQIGEKGPAPSWCRSLFCVELMVGIEPTTYALRVRRSAIEPHQRVRIFTVVPQNKHQINTTVNFSKALYFLKALRYNDFINKDVP